MKGELTLLDQQFRAVAALSWGLGSIPTIHEVVHIICNSSARGTPLLASVRPGPQVVQKQSRRKKNMNTHKIIWMHLRAFFFASFYNKLNWSCWREESQSRFLQKRLEREEEQCFSSSRWTSWDQLRCLKEKKKCTNTTQAHWEGKETYLSLISFRKIKWKGQ